MYSKVAFVFVVGLSFFAHPFVESYAAQTVEIREFCPTPAAVPAPQDDAGVRTFVQLQSYASNNPESFGYLESLPGGQIAIALTGELQTPQAALVKALDFPERATICSARFTKLGSKSSRKKF